MSDKSNDLFLTVCNEGRGYEARCRLARIPRQPQGWVLHALAAARKYERDFEDGCTLFTTADILECAVALEEYYLRHVREAEALERIIR